MTTKTEICDIALARVRAGSVTDVDTENSPQAIQCRRFFDATRDLLLASFPWAFARRVQKLTKTANGPVEWAFEYDYPNAAVKIRYIVPPELAQSLGDAGFQGMHLTEPLTEMARIPFAVSGSSELTTDDKVILTNLDDAYAVYTEKVTTIDRWTTLFIEALKWRLAMELAVVLGGDSTKYYADKAETGFNRVMRGATAQDVNEGEKGAVRLPASIAARYSYGIWRGDRPYRYSG